MRREDEYLHITGHKFESRQHGYFGLDTKEAKTILSKYTFDKLFMDSLKAKN